MILTPKQIDAQYRKIIKKQADLDNQLKRLREDAQGVCQHAFTETYTKDCDDGYGKWWKINYTYCKLCQKDIKERRI